MDRPVTDDQGFPEVAKSLARNPLGVIALFITLVQSFATLLLGFGGNEWQSSEKLPLIWFVVLFPLVVLWVFYVLVTKYHGNLYAPSDYRSDLGFPQPLTRLESASRLKRKTDLAEPASPIEERKLNVLVNQTHPDFTPKTVEEDKRIRSMYLRAETLAIKRLEWFYGSKFVRQVGFGNGVETAFDGVISDDDTYIAVEVKLLARPSVESSQLQEVIDRGLSASTLISKKSKKKLFRLILAFVLEFKETEGIEEFTRKVRLTIQDAPFPVDFHIFALSDLEKEFGGNGG